MLMGRSHLGFEIEVVVERLRELLLGAFQLRFQHLDLLVGDEGGRGVEN